MAVAALPTPRPRGTNYEAMPSIPKRIEKAPNGVGADVSGG